MDRGQNHRQNGKKIKDKDELYSRIQRGFVKKKGKDREKEKRKKQVKRRS
jgi:hypothetical protein